MLNVRRVTICAAALSAAFILSGAALAQRQGGGPGNGPGGASAGAAANVSGATSAPSGRGASSRMGGGNFAGRGGMRNGNFRSGNFATSRGMRGSRYTANNYRGNGNWQNGRRDHRGRHFARGFGLGFGVGSYYGDGFGYDGGPYAYDYGDYGDYDVSGGPDYAENDAVQYCMQRFRSYDPQSGTYLGYDGERHPCP
ncbi:MAG TPA: BA14K family protein [Pseudolabrys sp.]|nr:BA14K family protein [Pseudolabrys sp.]